MNYPSSAIAGRWKAVRICVWLASLFELLLEKDFIGGKVYILKSQGHLEQNTTIGKSNALWEISFLSPPHTKRKSKEVPEGNIYPRFHGLTERLLPFPFLHW